MSNSTRVTTAPKKKRGFLRAIAWFLGILIVLLVVVFFVTTSSAFLKGTILPRVGKAMNAQITVSDASIRPFKQVILRDLKVQTTGTEPLVTAAEVRLRYSLMDILRGNIRVDEVKVASLTVALVEHPDGSSNLDPILKSLQTGDPEKKREAPETKPTASATKTSTPATKPAASAKSSVAKPLQIDVKQFALTDATFSRVKNFANGTREVAELSHANLTLDDLKNGQTAQLVLGTDIHIQQTNAMLQAKLAGTFTLALTADLKPSQIRGRSRLEVTQAAGALADAADFSSEINVAVTPTEIKEMALRFQRGDANLGELRVSGPFDMQKLEGRLSIVLADIDKQLLNLVGASRGMDFGNTTIYSTNEVELTQGGAMITAKGKLGVNAFQLTQSNQTTPQLDLNNAYDVTVDRSQRMATMRNLTMTGTQKGDALLKAELTSPMQISWGDVSNAIGDSAFTLTVSDFNLADWKPFVGEVAPAGVVNIMAKVLSQQGGKQLTLDLDSQIDHLTVNAGSNSIADASVSLNAHAKATDLKQFNLMDCRLEIAHQNEALAAITASGTYDMESSSADMDIQINLTPTTRASNKLQLTGQLDMSQPSAIQGNLTLAADSLDFTRYYDLFMGDKQAFAPAAASAPATASAPAKASPPVAASAPASASASASAPGDANKEPDPITLPFSNVTLSTSIKQLYLLDVEIADWQTTTKIDDHHVVVTPFELTLNGAPVNATLDLDLGLSGWKYDLSFSAQDVPLAPLVDSFQPESKGQLGGTVIAQGHISGAGITGASLQKHLNGQFDINSTNLNLSAENTKNPILTVLIKVVASIPELLQHPKDKLESLLGELIDKIAPTGGEAHDLQQSPINAIILQGTADSGRIELQKAVVQSPNFQADVDGGFVMLASVLTNSAIQIPVSISLSRSIADRIGLVPANTPTNAVFVKVPDFLTLTGTVGVPKPKINVLALAGTVTSVAKELRDSFKELRDSHKGVKSGQPDAATQSDQPAAATPQEPPAAEPNLEDVLKGLLRKRKK